MSVSESSGSSNCPQIAGICAGVSRRNGTSQTVFVGCSLTLVGGYSPNNWITPYPVNNPTILDALGLGRVVFVSHANLTLENMILVNGDAPVDGTGACPAFGCGGGLYTDGSLSLSNVTFENNKAGRAGGMYVAGRLSALYSVWLDNTATTQRGGAIEVNGDAVLIGGLVQGNDAFYGGGLFTDAGLVISGTQLINNVATDPGMGAGGALYATGLLEIHNALFANNQSPTNGGAVAHYPALASEKLVVMGTQFINNNAITVLGGQTYGFGGAIYAAGQLEITGSQFQDNHAIGGGGALHTLGETAIQTSHFQGNSSTAWGGAIYAQMPLTITTTTLISNTADSYGGAIF